MAAPSKSKSEKCLAATSSNRKAISSGILSSLLGTSKLDEAIGKCSSGIGGLGIQELGCCHPLAPCGPCGAFGPVFCPCQLCSPPMGTCCAVILQPKCKSTVRGCRMCCTYSCLPCKGCDRPRCLKQRPCCFC